MEDRPTIPAWAAATIRDLQKQIDRLMTGRACRECKGACEVVQGGKAGAYVRACFSCDGTGLDSGGSHCRTDDRVTNLPIRET